MLTGYLLREIQKANIAVPEEDESPLAPPPRQVLEIMVRVISLFVIKRPLHIYFTRTVVFFFWWVFISCCIVPQTHNILPAWLALFLIAPDFPGKVTLHTSRSDATWAWTCLFTAEASFLHLVYKTTSIRLKSKWDYLWRGYTKINTSCKILLRNKVTVI